MNPSKRQITLNKIYFVRKPIPFGFRNLNPNPEISNMFNLNSNQVYPTSWTRFILIQGEIRTKSEVFAVNLEILKNWLVFVYKYTDVCNFEFFSGFRLGVRNRNARLGQRITETGRVENLKISYSDKFVRSYNLHRFWVVTVFE